MATERELRQLRNDTAPGVASHWSDFNSTGDIFATAYADGVRLWNIKSAREIAFLPIGWTWDCAFERGQDRLLTCTAAGLQRWPFSGDASSNFIHVGKPETIGSRDGVLQVSIGRQGLLTFVQNNKIHIFDPRTGQERKPLSANYPFTRVTMSADETLLAAWGRPAIEFQVREVASGKLVKTFPGSGGGFARFSPDGRRLALGDNDGYQLLEVGSWKPLFSTNQPGLVVREFAFSKDSRILAVAHSETVVQLLDSASGCELAILEPPDPQLVSWIGFSPDDVQLAVTCNYRVIQLWDLRLIRRELAEMKLDWEPQQSE